MLCRCGSFQDKACVLLWKSGSKQLKIQKKVDIRHEKRLEGNEANGNNDWLG